MCGSRCIVGPQRGVLIEGGRKQPRSYLHAKRSGVNIFCFHRRNRVRKMETPSKYIYLYLLTLFCQRTGIWSGVFFVSRPHYGILGNWNFSVKSLRSGAVFGRGLQRPSPCLIRSEPRRERGWGLSETSEKLLKCCILKRYS